MKEFGRRRIRVSSDGNIYWRTFCDTILVPYVTPAAIERFAGHIRSGVDVEQLSLRECTMVQDGFGYAIPPHTDAPHKKVVTLIFYLPRSDDQADLGTCLLRPRRALPAGTGEYQWQAWKDFEVVERVPFVPNRLFAFVVNAQSFHAVPRIWRFVRRKSLQAIIA